MVILRSLVHWPYLTSEFQGHLLVGDGTSQLDDMSAVELLWLLLHVSHIYI